MVDGNSSSSSSSSGDGDGDDEAPVVAVEDQDEEEEAKQQPPPPLHLLLDAGYGIPREARPRQEKILAIAKQIANFLQWQLQQQQQQCLPVQVVAPVTVVGCETEGMQEALLERLKKLCVTTINSKEQKSSSGKEDKAAGPIDLPSNFSFARDTDHSKELLQDAVYLSPDSPSSLNPSQPPPSKVIVGLLIDRRIQINRSLQRSQQLQLASKRWPMEVLAANTDYHPQEPLNVDTILEALQQWSWNCSSSDVTTNDDTPFVKASIQAFRHHEQRHPSRPKHRLHTT